MSCYHHPAHGSIRMEPVFMSFGQVAAIAAELAIRGDQLVQATGYEALAARLTIAGVVLKWNPLVPVSGADMHAWEG